MFLPGHANDERGWIRRCHHGTPGPRPPLRVVGTGDSLALRIENLDECVVVALVDLDQVSVARHDGKVCGHRLHACDLQRAFGERWSSERRSARHARRSPWRGPPCQNHRCKKQPGGASTVRPRLPCLAPAAYTAFMPGLDNHAAPVAILPAQADLPAPVSDPVSHLAAVYRDYPGLRALILRRVGDAEVAADILQDAAVTTLEKLRSGEIAHPENLGGYLYRVALNHLRNHRRKDRSPASSADAVEDLRDAEDDPDWARVGRPQWARAARRMLEEMPVARDRDVLVRFYLDDEDKEGICRELRLSEEHFNRVIFRARNRFRELLERRGFWKADLLAIIAISLCVSDGGCGIQGPAARAVHAWNCAADAVHALRKET